MGHWKRALFATTAIAALACSKLGATTGSGNEGGATASGEPAAGGSAATPTACLTGKWDAKDLSSKIKGAIKSAANAGLTPAGGKITYDFSAASDGKGVVAVTPTDFVSKMALSQQGVNINGTITLGGTAKMPYTLGPPDALTIAPPTEGKINAHADVQTSGIVNTRKTEDSVVDLSGSFLYECAGDKLQLWNKSQGKQSAPLVFARIK